MQTGREGMNRVDELLRHFGGDVDRAIAALNEYKAQTARAWQDRSKPEPTGPVLVEVTDATKTYKLGRQNVEALRGASLRIHEGEFVAITGPSGSGKSTLLQLIGALDTPTTGTITVNGVDLRSMRDRKLAAFRAETIGFVFQFFYLQPFLTLRQNLEVPSMFVRAPRDARRTRALQLAEKTGLSDRVNHLPRELSGGQMQRAAIARALMNSPKLLLADEPTGNLDSQNGKVIIDLFELIRRDLGMTIVVVTHDQAVASRADRVIHVEDGRIAS